MNKYLIFIVPIAILSLALGAFGYQYLTKQNSGQVETPAVEDSAPKTESKSQQFKITDLLNSDASYRCTFDYQAENEDASRGEIFVAQRGQKMRGTFISSMGDRPDIEGNILRDGQYQYFWQTGENEGMKFLIDEADDDIFSTGGDLDDNTVDQSEDEAFEDNTLVQSPDMDYTCLPWIIDESKFTVPGDINFVDFQAQMEQLKSTMPALEELPDGEESNAANCGVCDQVPAGEARQQCLDALGC